MDNEQFFRLCWLSLKKSKPRLSQEMLQVERDFVEHDNYFRVCWITLRLSKPRLSRLMTTVEIVIADAPRISFAPDKTDEEPEDVNQPDFIQV